MAGASTAGTRRPRSAKTPVPGKPGILSLPPGQPPSQEEILAEAEADREGSTAPPGVPTDHCEQLDEARRILRWLTGTSDEIPADCEDRGRLIGARDDYARTDNEIRAMRDAARRGLELAGTSQPSAGDNPWQWEPAAMNAAGCAASATCSTGPSVTAPTHPSAARTSDSRPPAT
jgi:hypothetical protein